jgi:hypothetical protein
MVAWVMMGVAIWHFAVFVPERFWGGIVGALIGAIAGAVVVGLVINGFTIPGRHTTHVLTAIDAVPGAILGLAVFYLEGVRRERLAGA